MCIRILLGVWGRSPGGVEGLGGQSRSSGGAGERLIYGGAFCRTGWAALQQGAIAAVHERERLVDQPLGAAALGGCFPFGATADREARVDQPVGDFVGAGSHFARRQQRIENAEEQMKAARLKGGRPHGAGAAAGRNAREPQIKPPRCLGSPNHRAVARDHIGERLSGPGIANPEVMAAARVAQDDMASVRKRDVGKDIRPVIE